MEDGTAKNLFYHGLQSYTRHAARGLLFEPYTAKIASNPVRLARFRSGRPTTRSISLIALGLRPVTSAVLPAVHPLFRLRCLYVPSVGCRLGDLLALTRDYPRPSAASNT